MEPKKPTTYSRGWSTQSQSSEAHRRRLSFSKKTIVIAIIIFVVIVTGRIVIGLLVSQSNSTKHATSTSKIVTPSFQTITPNGESASKLGWERVSPPKSAPVFAYADTVSDVLVSVSEQQLPASFTTNTDSQIAELATAYNATDVVNAGSTKVYIGTSVKGPQSVIFTKSGLLILIKSEKVITDTAWAKYATSLS